MEFVSVERSAGMTAAHNDVDVIRATEAFRTHPTRPMLLLLHLAMYTRKDLTDAAVTWLLGQPPLLPGPELAAGKEVASCGLAISNHPEAGRRRAAVLENVVEILVTKRCGTAAVSTELAATGLPSRIYSNGLSKPFDVVTRPSPYELYECKTTSLNADGWNFNQDDLTAFDQVADIAAADGEVTVPVFATFETIAVLRAALAGLVSRRTVFASTLEDLQQLADHSPSVEAIAATR